MSEPYGFSNDEIAFIPCDGDIWTTSDRPAVSPAPCIIYFSRQSDFCDFSGYISNIDLIYTMENRSDTERMFEVPGVSDVYQVLPIYVRISQNKIDKHEGKPSKGLIAVFCVVTIVGILLLAAIVVAVIHVRRRRRQRRHGQLNNTARSPRPNQPRGPVTAILEALPIVKFGVKQEPGRAHIYHGPPVTGNTTQTHEIELAKSGAGDSSMPKQKEVVTEQADVTPRHSAATVTASHDNRSCSICTEDFEIGQDQRILPCTHRFHPTCVDPWLINGSATCPLCRTDLKQLMSSSSPEPERGGHGVPRQREERENTSEALERSPTTMSPVSRHSSLSSPHHVAREEWNSAMRGRRRQTTSRMPSEQRQGIIEDESRRQTWLWHTFHVRTRRTGENDGSA